MGMAEDDVGLGCASFTFIGDKGFRHLFAPDVNEYGMFGVVDETYCRGRSASVAVSRPDFDQPDVFRVTQYSLYPSFSYTVKGEEVAAPELTETETPYLVFWGDGSQEYFVKGLTHHYESAGPHTIRVEGLAFPLFELPKPADGMLYDFSKLNL